MPTRKISGHLTSDKQHMFHIKCHVLKKRIRKLYLKCRVRNCKQAFRPFHSVKALNVHHRIFHAKTLFKYLICPKRHRTPSSVRFHKYEHQMPAFTCTTCNKSFVFNSKLQQHRRVHIKQKLYCCFHRGCLKCYKHPEDLNRHAASHFIKKLECPLCDYSTDQRRLLKHHSTVHQNTPCYTCKRCGAGFKHYIQLYRHRQVC